MRRALGPQTRRAAELVTDCIQTLVADDWDWNGDEFGSVLVDDAALAVQDAMDDDPIFNGLDEDDRALMLRGWLHLAWLLAGQSRTVRQVQNSVEYRFHTAVFGSLNRAEQYRRAGFTARDAKALDKDNPTSDEIAFLGSLRHGSLRNRLVSA